MTQKNPDIARICKDSVRNANLVLNLVRDRKGNKKGFYRYSSSKKKRLWENVGLLNGAGDPVAKDTEEAEVLKTFLTSVFTGKSGTQQSQVSEMSWEVQNKKYSPLVEENQLREPFKPTG